MAGNWHMLVQLAFYPPVFLLPLIVLYFLKLCFWVMREVDLECLTVSQDTCKYTKWFCIKNKFPKPFHSGGRIVSVQDHSRIVTVRCAFLSSPINSFSIEALLWFTKAQNHPVSRLWHFLNYKWTWTSCWDIKIKLVANSENWSS